MKKHILTIIIIAAGITSFAMLPPTDTTLSPKKDTFKMSAHKTWSDSARPNMKHWNDSTRAKQEEGMYHFIEGKVVQKVKGKIIPVMQTITFSNGTTVSASGLVKSTDGATVQLKNKDRIDKNGNILLYTDSGM